MPELKLNNNCTINLSLSEPASIEAFFLFGLHKCGSSLLQKIFVDVCTELQIPDISIPEAAFKQGISTPIWSGNESLNDVIRDGYCVRGFRDFPSFLAGNKLLPQRKKILLVRDPRDALVSAYFSFAQSHPLPKKGQLLADIEKQRADIMGMDIESYVVNNAPTFKNAFNKYQHNIGDNPLLKTYRYEDIIFDKYNWIKDMLNFLDLSLEESKIDEIAKKHNIVPIAEDTSSHVRKVKPGDHREKLSAECIAKINEVLAEVLDRHNYEH